MQENNSFLENKATNNLNAAKLAFSSPAYIIQCSTISDIIS